MKTIRISCVAGLCLAAILNGPAQTPPNITTKYPTNMSVSLCGTAAFQVFAFSSFLGYQWYANGVPIPGATLKLTGVSPKKQFPISRPNPLFRSAQRYPRSANPMTR